MLSLHETLNAEHVRDVILRDGRTLRLRPPELADTRPLVDFFRGLDSRRPQPVPALPWVVHIDAQAVEGLLDPDWSIRGALIGLLQGENGDEVVAVASYARLRNPSRAEAAFAVATELPRCRDRPRRPPP